MDNYRVLKSSKDSRLHKYKEYPVALGSSRGLKTTTPKIDEPVFKIGRVTGLTEGTGANLKTCCISPRLAFASPWRSESRQRPRTSYRPKLSATCIINMQQAAPKLGSMQ